jgi:hypothetical protein
MSQVTVEQCTSQGCRPLAGQASQRLQVLPSRAACADLKAQMEQVTAASRTQPAVEVSAGGSTLRQYVTLQCREEP